MRGVGTTVTPRGMLRVAAVHAAVASFFLGGSKAVKIAFASLAAVFVGSTALAARKAPQSGMAEEFLKGITQGDSAGFIASLVGLMDVFDKCAPRRPPLCALRRARHQARHRRARRAQGV